MRCTVSRAQEIQRVFDGGADESQELTRDEARALAGGEMGAYLAERERTVWTLAGETAEAAAAEGARFAFLDASGAIKGYFDGRPTGGPAAEIAWTLGVDLARVGMATGALEAIAYAVDPDRIRLDLDAYRDLLPAGGTLSAALRPILPDCDSAENLGAKLGLGTRARRSSGSTSTTTASRRYLPSTGFARRYRQPEPRRRSERAARQLAGVAAVVDDEPAVDATYGMPSGSCFGSS